jgi:SAM-dependent methyltransferase
MRKLQSSPNRNTGHRWSFGEANLSSSSLHGEDRPAQRHVTEGVSSTVRMGGVERTYADADGPPGGVLGEAVLLGAMYWYAGTVLYPLHALRRAGLLPRPRLRGQAPLALPRPGLGPHFSSLNAKPVLLERESPRHHLVEEFDRFADLYHLFVEPFSRPIFSEALTVIGPFLARDARVLDLGCGSGGELCRVARRVPGGEVVGVDLAKRMVVAAHRMARARGLDNCAFFQADAGELPPDFTGRFDVVYSSLAHHHYPDPAAAARSVLRCLRAGGLYCVIDPGPAWFNAIATPFTKLGDPGWVGFRTPRQFRRLFERAGFARTCWVEILPGFGVTIGQKGRRAGRRDVRGVSGSS